MPTNIIRRSPPAPKAFDIGYLPASNNVQQLPHREGHPSTSNNTLLQHRPLCSPLLFSIPLVQHPPCSASLDNIKEQQAKKQQNFGKTLSTLIALSSYPSSSQCHLRKSSYVGALNLLWFKDTMLIMPL
ncbi:hypothetical protein MNL07_06415 [Bartonella krasnovii]|uniref:hypothetical protein n=1 Tax=Bartonella krasnovii TaxID=2267275 RepID=UPI001F4CC6D7|nr:hypothetical protein [Bartonella krasnovii]UNF40203.1 hypothetical protein MNL09_07070 [Bartonella krasnovii]UNF43522.1 hypothetical protein MNL07_06415 [Bartonella krasnovii]